MAKTNLILVILMMALIPSAIAVDSIVRGVPSSVAAGGTFSLTYTATATGSTWGATLIENIQGGCTVNGKTTLQFAMLSDLPNPLTYTVQAPSSNANCVFQGDYKFGTDAIVPFADATVEVGTAPCPSGQFLCNGVCAATCGECTSGATSSCSVGTCVGTKTCAAGAWGTCIKTVSTCGGTCPTGQVLCDGACATTCGGGEDDICTTLGKLDFISGTNSCTYGVGIIVAGLVLLMLLMKK
jgi:hypothetical protein